MQGIELAEICFKQHFLPELEKVCPEILPHIAAGLAGRGSECFGFDDDISKDHDFEPGFILWLNDEDEAHYGFQLTRLYNRIAAGFPGYGKSRTSKLGSAERGVMRIRDFFRRHLGIPGIPENLRQWLDIPEYAFAEVINGSVFYDPSGEISRIRDTIRTGIPEDARRKKLAAHLLFMAQSGQYNFARCLAHGERGAAALALSEFVQHAISAVFLLNHTFAPYYKWAFRMMKQLPLLGDSAEILQSLLAGENDKQKKIDGIESFCSQITGELHRQKLTASQENFLEPHAFEVMKGIISRELRAMHPME